MPEIHPSAVVDPKAQLAEDVQVGPFCYVGPRVTLGSGTHLISHVSVVGRTTLGENNTVWSHAAIGGDPQDLKFTGEDSAVIIGDHNEIREGVTVHKGTANDHGVTKIGNHNMIMAYTHVAHDCVLGNNIIVANSVQFAGHCHVEDHVVIGGLTAVHHLTTIGRFAFVGGMTRVVADVPPCMILEGNPSEVRGLNLIGLRRRGFTDESIHHLKDAFRRLFGVKARRSRISNTHATLQDLEDAYPHDPHVAELIAFMRRSESGVHGRYLESQRSDNRWTNKAR